MVDSRQRPGIDTAMPLTGLLLQRHERLASHPILCYGNHAIHRRRGLAMKRRREDRDPKRECAL